MPALARTTSTDIAAKRAGFSIIEMMIVIVIVGVMAMAVAPSMSEVLSGNRHASAAMDLVRFARSVRAAAVSSGAAQMMRFLKAGSGNLGTIDRYTGMTNRCLQSRWDIAITDPAHGPNRALAFDMATYNPRIAGAPNDDDTKQQIIKLRAASLGTTVTDLAELRVCYQPDGQVYAQYALGTPLVIQNVGVEFTISRTSQGDTHGRDRKVLFPIGGNARLE